MPEITYSLRPNSANSDDYYTTIAAFADRWLLEAAGQVGKLVADFQAFCRTTGRVARSDEECAFEALALGVTLREHGAEAAAMPGWLAWALGTLQSAEDRVPGAAGRLKGAREYVSGLAPERVMEPAQAGNLDRLVSWLRAQNQPVQANRFAQWLEFFHTIGAERERQAVADLLALAESFARDSVEALGMYTAGVDAYIAKNAARRKKRDDAAFVLRSRVEYHLGMLGTEVLNRVNQARFHEMPKKIVLLPVCIRTQPAAECESVETLLGQRCRDCTPACLGQQILKAARKAGVEVYLLSHERGNIHAEAERVGQRVGLVCVSCALTNWTSLWEAAELGVPVHGVLLDYASCQTHWDDTGFPTEVNMKRLKEVCSD